MHVIATGLVAFVTECEGEAHAHLRRFSAQLDRVDTMFFRRPLGIVGLFGVCERVGDLGSGFFGVDSSVDGKMLDCPDRPCPIAAFTDQFFLLREVDCTLDHQWTGCE